LALRPVIYGPRAVGARGATHGIASKEDALAKGQKKSNREIRKPKAAKAKPAGSAPSFLAPSSKKK
jgi:hypothetical protein